MSNRILSAKEINKRIHANPRKVWTEIVEEYGDEFFFQGNLCTANPNRVHELLHNRKHTTKRSKVYKSIGQFLLGTDGILFQDGDKWQNKLRQVMPTLTKLNVDQYRNDLYQLARQHTEEWKERGQSKDFYLDVTNLGMDMVLKLCFGLDPIDELSKKYGGVLRDFKLFMMYDTVRVDEFGLTIGDIKKVPGVIRDYLKMQKKIKEQKSLLNQLIKNKKVKENQLGWIALFQKAGMPLSEITTELNHIYAAFNAIDYLITCAIYALNAFPETQKPLLDELKNARPEEFMASKNFSIDYPETVAFMKEVLRFYPGTINVMRQSGEEFEAANKKCPIGTEVIILIQSLHFHPEYWEAPEQFNPTRFKKPLKEPKAYIPFLAGPRKCIGQHLAEIHFLHTLFVITQAGIPVIDTATFEIQPYMIPRLKYPLIAKYS